MKDETAYIIVAALVLFYLYRLGLAPDPPMAQAAAAIASVPAGWRQQFAVDLLHRLGNDAPTQATVNFIVEWTLAEDSGDGAMARNNPLNTTQGGYNATHSINEDGVKGYAAYADGLDATVQTLSYGYYTEIVAGLQTNDPDRAFQGLIASPWAASHYGGGANWPHINEGATP